MSLISRLYRRFVIGNIKEMDDEPDVDKWLIFLSSLKQPNDFIDESYNKYLCREFHFPMYKNLLLNIVSIPMAIWAIMNLFGKKIKLPNVPQGKLLIEKKADVDYEDIIPESLINSYQHISVIEDIKNENSRNRLYFTDEAKKLFIQTIKRHPFHFYYLYWVARELSKQCKYLMDYNCASCVVYIEERNVAGPIINHLYESTGRKYISFMHGEYLLRLIQGYMSFSEYYIWDNDYEDMFRNVLKCNIGEYIIYKPQKLTKKWNFEDSVPRYLCTYYFSAESKESIKKLSEIFYLLNDKGYKCKVRPHPRYSQWNIIAESFPKEMIEQPKDISIEESLRDTKYVVGLATTVLAEGYYEGKEIVVDDISSPDKFMNLEKRHFIVLKRPHILFSELLESLGI